MPIEILSAETLPQGQHGFFTRKGGASSGIFGGLNCGKGSSDQNSAVQENRNRVANAMGVLPSALHSVSQVHSADVVEIHADSPRHTADAMVTAEPNLALGILTADCAPVLFADEQAGVIGAAHAGWRGAFTGIIENTVAAMVQLGAQPARIRAVIGPCISQDNYEVGPDFRDNFLSTDAHNATYFRDGPNGRPMFDLPQFVLDRLDKAGVPHALWCGQCTYADEDRFYSYRRSTHRGEADYGRLISVIRQ